MGRIAEIPNVAGIKEACGNMEQIMHTAREVRGKCELYSGDDHLNLPMLAIGAADVYKRQVVDGHARRFAVFHIHARKHAKDVYKRQYDDRFACLL